MSWTSTLGSITAVLRAYYEDTWGISDVRTQNEGRASDDAQPEAVVTWVRLNYIAGSSFHFQMGDRSSRMEGRIVQQIFVPKGRGLGAATKIADGVIEQMETLVVPSLRFFASSQTAIGPAGDFYQVNVTTPIRFTMDR